MKILISTDTSSILNYGILEKNNISIYPLNVIIDGEEFLDGVTIKQDKLNEAMRANKVIKTSTPPLGEVIEYFENKLGEGYDHVIHFTISSKLSSMYNLFSNVAQNEFPGKVTIIDSLAISTIMLSHILYAKEEVEKGTKISEICAEIENRKKNSYICFIPENLTALKNGGRISPAAAAIGNTIGLKPIILLKDGELVKDSVTRSPKKKFKEHLDKCIETFPIENYDYSICDFYADELTVGVAKEYLEELIGKENVIRGILPINVCAHCGPGTYGVIISPKINGKTIKEFI